MHAGVLAAGPHYDLHAFAADWCVPLQITFEDAAKRESHDGQASSSSAPEHGGQETVAERTTLADTASGLATQVVAGLRDGAAGVVSNVREVVGRYAAAQDESHLACSHLACFRCHLPL